MTTNEILTGIVIFILLIAVYLYMRHRKRKRIQTLVDGILEEQKKNLNTSAKT